MILSAGFFTIAAGLFVILLMATITLDLVVRHWRVFLAAAVLVWLYASYGG